MSTLLRRLGRRSTSGSAPVYLHIGAMKTGTTYIQTLLEGSRAPLADRGFLLPGRPAELTHGARDILGLTLGDEALAAQVDGVWASQVDAMRRWDGVASVYSMEFFASAEGDKAAEVIESLAGLDVHVVLTIRDALSALPAEWQRWTRNRGTIGWPEYVEQVREGRPGSARRMFSRCQDIIRMVDTWAPLVPEDRFHVVTVQPSTAPRELLWERFASVIGVDAEAGDTSRVRSNPSLGYGSCDLMRRINPVMTGTRHLAYKRVERYSGRNLLGPRRDVEPRHRLDAATAAFAAEWNAGVRDHLTAGGIHVVGDLEDLPTEVDPSAYDPGDRPVEIDPEVVAAAAAVQVAGLEAWRADEGRALPPRDSPERTDALTRGRRVDVEGLPEPVAAEVRAAAATMRLCIEQV